MNRFLLFCYCAATLCCSRQPSADDLIQDSQKIVCREDTIRTWLEVADCLGPSGRYRTEIHSGTGNYLYFKQTFSGNRKPFEAVSESLYHGYEVEGDERIVLAKEIIYALRSHEFHKLLLELDKRFHAFQIPSDDKFYDSDVLSVKCLDELGHDATLFFDVDSHRVVGLLFTNPNDVKEVLKIRYSNWQTFNGCVLPWHVDIDQSGKIFTFDYQQIEINGRSFTRKSG